MRMQLSEFGNIDSSYLFSRAKFARGGDSQKDWMGQPQLHEWRVFRRLTDRDMELFDIDTVGISIKGTLCPESFLWPVTVVEMGGFLTLNSFLKDR
jgi:hypothetical protein